MTEIKARWLGDMLEPMRDSQVWLNENMVVGMVYRLDVIFPRDRNLHAARFAALGEAYRQLPERYAKMFVNFEHFRKWLLVKEGYCTIEDFAAASNTEAHRYLLMHERSHDKPGHKDFKFAVIEGNVVRIITPTSMGEKSMKPDEFREATSKMLERAADMIGISVSDLRQNTNRSA